MAPYRKYQGKTYPNAKGSVESMERLGRKIFTPSSYQQAIFDHVPALARGKGNNLIIQAVAGSGKTTTLVELLWRLKDEGFQGSAVMLAFSKKDSEELKRRVPEPFEASTLHSFGYKALSSISKRRIEQGNVINLLKDILRIRDNRELTETEKKDNNAKWRFAYYCKKVISLLKNNAVKYNEVTESLVDDIEFFYGLDKPTGSGESVSEVCAQVLKTNSTNNFFIDFDDMIYLPSVLGINPPKVDIVLVDESQDLNKAQIGLLQLMHKANPQTRFIFVGDRAQAIYGFRGALTGSMDWIKQEFDCVELPLSVCYRCARDIVEHAQQVLTSTKIEACQSAPKGRVIEIETPEETFKLIKNNIGKVALLCRKNAELVLTAYKLIRDGIPAIIVGRDIAEGLIELVEKLSKDKDEMDLETFYPILRQWEEKEIASLSRKQGNESKIIETQDKSETLAILWEDCQTVGEVKAKIERLFGDDGDTKGKVQLMTIHRSKGREFSIVGIIRTNPLPVRQDWQREQEANLLYVARTRAQETLFYFSPRPE